MPQAPFSNSQDSRGFQELRSNFAAFETTWTCISFQSNEFILGWKKSSRLRGSGMGVAFLLSIAAICEAQKWRWSMKFQKIIRVQLMLMGLGAGLLMARPVFAQQDMDPTLFEAASDAPQLDQAAMKATPAPGPATIVTTDSTPLPAAEDVGAVQLTAMDKETIAFLMAGIGSIVLLGMAEAIRGSRRRTWRERASNGLPAGATAN